MSRPVCARDALDERLDRRSGAELVQRRRAQVADQRAEVRDARRDHVDGLVHRRVEPRRLVAAARAGQQHLEPRELLQRLVVQLARPAPALLLGGLHAAPQRLVRRGLRRRDGRRRARGERLQQPLVLLGERAVARRRGRTR